MFQPSFVMKLAGGLLAASLTLFSGCDALEQLSGADPVNAVVRDNPVDPVSAKPLVFGLDSGVTVVGTVRPSVRFVFSAEVASYTLQIASSKTFVSPVVYEETGITGAVHKIGASLANHGSYFWRVRPRFVGGVEGGWSETRVLSIELPVPEPKYPVSTSTLTSKDTSLSWSGSAGLSVQYCYEISATSDFSAPLESAQVSASETAVHLKQAGPLYFWRVKVLDHGVAGEWSPPVAFAGPKGVFQPMAAPTSPTDIENSSNTAVGDLNGDGLLDFVVLCWTRLLVYYQKAEGGFEVPVVLSTPYSLDDVLIQDVNGDSLPDLVVCAYHEQYEGRRGHLVFWAQDSATHALETMSELPTNLDMMASIWGGDLDRDGMADLVVVGSQSTTRKIAILKQSPLGTFTETHFSDTSLDWGFRGGVFVADMNGDQRVDIVVPIGPWLSVAIFHQSAQGLFDSPPETITFSDDFDSPHFAVGDLNGDGLTDLVFSGTYWSSAVQAVLQSPNGTLGSPFTLLPGGSTSGEVQIADMDGDGLNDLVFARSGIVYQTPAHTFQEFVGIPLGSNISGHVEGWRSFSIADINGDGTLDLIEPYYGLYLFAQQKPWAE